MIASTIQVAPLQSAGELIHNIQNSLTKVIDATLRKLVERLIRKERRQINSVLPEEVVVDNTIRSLAKLTDAIWFGDVVSKHIAGECLDMFKVYIVGWRMTVLCS